MKSFTRKKLIALFALAVLAFAGVAWAVAFPGTLTLSGTNSNNYVMGLTDKTSTFHTITGNGTLTGSITDNQGALVLLINAAATNNVTIAPADNRLIDLGATNQLVINDGASNNGTVLIRASNAETGLVLGTRTSYGGGTLVDGGTLGITHNNSLGQGWAAILGRTTAESRAGATLQSFGSGTLTLGANSPGGTVTIQPLYLTYRNRTLRDGDVPAYGAKLATINVGDTGGVQQELHLIQGVGEGRLTEIKTGTASAGPTLDGSPDVPAVLAPYDTAAGYLRDGFYASGTGVSLDMAGRLVKAGAGTLVVAEYTPNSAAGATPPADAFHEIRGMAHTGGTIVEAGTLKVDGYNANAYENHFTGFVGSMWSSYIPSEAYDTLMDGGGRVPKYFVNTPISRGDNNNPFFLNGGSAIVNRAQMFSDFNTAAGTSFTASEYTLGGAGTGVNYRPVINVMLMQRPSVAAGKLSGSFDLVLNSITNGNGRNLIEDSNPNFLVAAQARLTVSNTANEIFGQTFINNGVLAIGGAKSIGSGNLTVGTTYTPVRGVNTPYNGKAVFLGLADATFANKTYVNGPTDWSKIGPSSQPEVWGLGALATETGTTIAFNDVTVTGAMEINPQAVREEVYWAAQNVVGPVVWDNYQELYPTWGGTVAFGGEGHTYSLNGSVYVPTKVIVSRGTWKLNSYPADNGFAQITLRETATLSLAKGVNDFSQRFDVQVDDDSRIRVVPTAADVATSQSAARANNALFAVRTIDTTWLGSGQENKDNRLAIQVDLSEVGSLAKGSWIKVVGAEDAVRWNNIHYLRDNSDTFYEDYAKVRPGLINNADLSTQVKAHVEENPYAIYLEVVEAVDPTVPTTSYFTFDSTGTAVMTNAQISGSALVKDSGGLAVASEDVTFYLFHAGVDTSDNANAIEHMTSTSDANGYASYLFNAGGYGNGAGYIVKAVSSYGSGTKSLTTSGSGGGSSSSSGCDAGFGAFALLTLAGGALVLRKKD